MMKIIRAQHAGACYGVERALKMVYDAIMESGADEQVYTLGPLIHNPRVVKHLESLGVCAIEQDDDIDEGTLVIRSHGVAPDVIDRARQRGLTVLDATCPHVLNAQKAASELNARGYTVIVVGEAGHPEVEGICAYAGEGTLVVGHPADIPDDLPSDHIGVVVQTTQSPEALAAVVDALRERVGRLVVRDTICGATLHRQQAAHELATQVDAVIVVGGRNSGNTTRLAEICRAACPRTHHIEGPEEIQSTWLSGCETIGITAGASTPETQIDTVIERLKCLEVVDDA